MNPSVGVCSFTENGLLALEGVIFEGLWRGLFVHPTSSEVNHRPHPDTSLKASPSPE